MKKRVLSLINKGEPSLEELSKGTVKAVENALELLRMRLGAGNIIDALLKHQDRIEKLEWEVSKLNGHHHEL